MPVVDPDIEAYAEAHTTPPREELTILAAETTVDTDFPRMMVGALEGRFLEFMVHMTGARRILEIGTFTGYSALSMAPAMPAGGSITTCELDTKHAEIARRAVAASPYAESIDIRVGPALDTIETLAGPFDLVFIDADKSNYRNYYEAILPKLADGGVIAADNTLWAGRVLEDTATDDDTAAIREFNDHVRNDPRVVCVLLTVRDGVTLIRRV